MGDSGVFSVAPCVGKSSRRGLETVMPGKYRGANHVHEDVATALRILGQLLSVTAHECESHTVLKVQGFGSPRTLQATAVYLVGAITQCIEADLQIRKALFDELTLSRDLAADVRAVIGDENASANFKTLRRDPWIWEGISHLAIHLARGNASFHPPGPVLAKTQLKYDVNDHGLDLVAIYDGISLGITAGESKAYFDDPTRAVGDAARRLSEVDKNLRDVEIRACVTQLRPALPKQHQERLGGAFWREERSYYPFVCCDETAALDWDGKRKVLGNLNVSASRKLLVPLALDGARRAYDEIVRLMRGYADGSLRF
jgi:hypothetical protein